jgi:hypothetical protein
MLHRAPTCCIATQIESVLQVLASALVSVLLVGLKLNAAKEIYQICERRAELKKNLGLLRWKLEVFFFVARFAR